MSSLSVRRVITELDLEAYKAVYADVWRRGEPFPEGEIDPGDGASRFVGAWDGEDACVFKAHDYLINRGDAELRCAGVASVGVKPEFRSLGVGSELMVWSLRALRDQGYTAAALYPFRGVYYRKFGYEFCGFRWQIRCPMDRFPMFDQELPVRRLHPDHLAELDACYRAFVQDLNGANLRSPFHWQQRLGKRAPMIYAVGDPVEAYAFTSMDGGFWEDLSFGEVVWSTERGYRSLMAFLRGLGINRSALVWSEPTHGPFLSRYLDQGADVSLHRPAMYRLLDLPGALASVKTATEGRLVLHVDDPELPENSGRWSWASGPSGSVIGRTDEEPDVVASIGALTQAFLGEPSLERLVAAGALQVRNLEAAARLFPASPVFCTEFF